MQAALFYESSSGKPCAAAFPQIGMDSPGRVVFMAFPIDTISQDGTPPDDEVTLFRNILNFLVPGANNAEAIMDSAVYTFAGCDDDSTRRSGVSRRRKGAGSPARPVPAPTSLS